MDATKNTTHDFTKKQLGKILSAESRVIGEWIKVPPSISAPTGNGAKPSHTPLDLTTSTISPARAPAKSERADLREAEPPSLQAATVTPVVVSREEDSLSPAAQSDPSLPEEGYLSDKPTRPGQAELITKPLSEFTRKKIAWLPISRFKIPQGKLTLFVGDPGNGKSLVVESIIAELTGAGKSAIVLSEDDAADMLRPRIEEMGGDLAWIRIVEGVKTSRGTRGFFLTADIAALEREIARFRPDVVLFDPLISYTPAEVDTFKGNSVRAFLDPLVRLATKYSFALLGVIHLNKADTKAIYKISGSAQYAAIAKCIYLVGQNPDSGDSDSFIVCHLKSNLSRKAPSVTFRIESAPTDPELPILVWGSEARVSVDDVVGGPSTGAQGGLSKLEFAKALIRVALSPGPRSERELGLLLADEGISQRTYERARKELGVQSRPIQQEGSGRVEKWLLYLPGTPPALTEPDKPASEPTSQRGP